MKNYIISRIIFFFVFITMLMSNDAYTYSSSSFNQFKEDQSGYRVEVGIESVKKYEDECIISVYAINPYDKIAGIQFKIMPPEVFVIQDVYGGRSKEKDFDIHFNKTGTILGFSMVANTIDISTTVSGPNQFKENIILHIKAKYSDIEKYLKDSFITMECVFASKEGTVLPAKFIPFPFSKIIE